MSLFHAYVKADTEERALAIARTLEEDEIQEVSVTWDGPILTEAAEDEAHRPRWCGVRRGEPCSPSVSLRDAGC